MWRSNGSSTYICALSSYQGETGEKNRGFGDGEGGALLTLRMCILAEDSRLC